MSIFNTDKRIKLGIWGLGRGGNFFKSASFLNIDVVAGCDIHQEIRERFQKEAPNTFCTDDPEKFLACDMDAVLIATYLPDHARHILMALEAGKHVLCEVIPFRTPADAVRIVEAVEKSGKIFNLLENYPYSKENMYVQKLWQEGFFGDFMYGEFEYLHEARVLAYGYNSFPTIPVTPGYTVHNWRADLNIHYYCTHSLGPAMYITGLRPTAVSALKDEVTLTGALRHATAAPAMIKMSNGGLVRNLMGSTTSDYHRGMRIWGTKAAAENFDKLKIRTGASGSNGIVYEIDAKFPTLNEEAEKAGHWGGDFWELYFFAREFFTGEPAFWNIYRACDVTLAGIMAIRSERQDGKLIEIPDFRDKNIRDLYRNDNGEQTRLFDPENIFPEGHDKTLTSQYTKVMCELFPRRKGGLVQLKNVFDGIKLVMDARNTSAMVELHNAVNQVIRELPQMYENIQIAQQIADKYPDSLPGKKLREVLDNWDIDKILNYEQTISELRDWQNFFSTQSWF